eukprot:scaffold95075_cov31-Tisochrysis_lutea.AAC.1
MELATLPSSLSAAPADQDMADAMQLRTARRAMATPDQVPASHCSCPDQNDAPYSTNALHRYMNFTDTLIKRQHPDLVSFP